MCLDRVIFHLKPFDLNDFSLKLTKYLMFPNSHFCLKIWNRAFPENSSSCICNTSVPRALHNLVVANQMVDKNPLRIVALLLYSNKSIHWTLKVDRESCYCAFLLRIKIIQIVLLLLLVYSPAFSFMSWWTWQLRFLLEWHLGEFHDLRKHCISYTIKSITFCKLLLFFQNKARIPDSL